MDLPTVPSAPPGRIGDNGSDDGHKGNLPPPPPPPIPLRGDPSKSRRDALKRHERPPIVLSNLCPVEKYYAAAEKVLRQFKDHLARSELDEAYIIGLRFALFATVSLPSHDYYTSPKGELIRLRLQNRKDAQWVTRGLERIVEVMDRQEIEKQKEEAERLKKQREEEELKWEETMIQRLGSVVASGSGDDASDMASKLEKLNTLFPQDGDNLTEEEVDEIPPLPPPMAPPPIGEQDLAPMSPVDPPRYTDLFLDTLRTSMSSVGSEELAALERPPSSTSLSPPIEPRPEPRLPVRVTQKNCMRELQSRLNSKQIEITRLGTYQGRLGASSPRYDSTNGCAVISPLVVATHIFPQHVGKAQRQPNASQYSVSNSAVNDIMDKRAPPILQKVRAKLGLNRHALIIPSDVHDYLVDERILPQDKFVGVCGGDILNDRHVGELVHMLVHGKEENKHNTDGAKCEKSCRKRKVGAALFFREHVISILKVPLGNGVCYYDLIDSLPSARTGGMASRTRCKDLESLKALLRWYASSKFSDSHLDFIDGNEWDDGMCDFDPRVFQGFCWAE